MSSRVLFIVITFFLGLNSLFSQNGEQIVIGNKYFIESKVLQEEREYWLSLPNSYDINELSYKKYPILILLDGNVHFSSVSGMVNFMSSGNSDKRLIPEMIVVAILSVNRERDFTPDKIITKRENQTGGGDNFLLFLESELIPKIEKEYRTIPYRILAGHSLGGLITTHAYMKENTSFNSFISIDPSFGSWDNKVMDEKVGNLNEKVFGRPLFIATANWGKRNLRNRDRHIRFFEVLNSKSKDIFNVEQKYYLDKNHSSVPLLGFHDGLTFIFKGYNQSFREVADINKLIFQYDEFSKKNSFTFLPPEELVNRIGYRFLHSKNIEDKRKSLSFFKLNSKNYPKSFNVFDSLGEAQYQLGYEEEAIKSFQISLELNAENQNARRMLDKIKK